METAVGEGEEANLGGVPVGARGGIRALGVDVVDADALFEEDSDRGDVDADRGAESAVQAGLDFDDLVAFERDPGGLGAARISEDRSADEAALLEGEEVEEGGAAARTSGLASEGFDGEEAAAVIGADGVEGDSSAIRRGSEGAEAANRNTSLLPLNEGDGAEGVAVGEAGEGEPDESVARGRVAEDHLNVARGEELWRRAWGRGVAARRLVDEWATRALVERAGTTAHEEPDPVVGAEGGRFAMRRCGELDAAEWELGGSMDAGGCEGEGEDDGKAHHGARLQSVVWRRGPPRSSSAAMPESPDVM